MIHANWMMGVTKKVQILKKGRAGNPDAWGEATDTVLAERRGATTLERYIDPNDERLPDFTQLAFNHPDANLDRYYRFRVVSSSTFRP